MNPTVPFDQWIADREANRAASSRLGRSLFEFPTASRAATEEERHAAEVLGTQEAARDRGRKKKNWRRRGAEGRGRAS